ncbi:hypothetical protein EDB85DRAFT_2282126, partial [Lactarius pseudohatsudake]
SGARRHSPDSRSASEVPRVHPDQSRRRLRSRSEAETRRTASSWVLKFNLTLSYNRAVSHRPCTFTSFTDALAFRVWVSSGDATAVAVKGFRFIHATPNSFYLDCGAGLHLRPAREPDCRASAACARRAAENSPARRTLTLLPDPARPRPRRSLWSGPGGNVSAALPRLHELGYRSRNRGVQTIALRPFACDLTV